MRRLGFILSLVILVALLSPSQRSRLGRRPRIAHRIPPSRKARSRGRILRGRAACGQERHGGGGDPARLLAGRSAPALRSAGWKRGGSDVWAHGGEYVTAGASTSEARFKLKTPERRLRPTPGGRSGRTAAVPRFGVETARGTRWIEVNQARDGGMWVKLAPTR